MKQIVTGYGKRLECTLEFARSHKCERLYITLTRYVALPTTAPELELLKKQHCSTSEGAAELHGLFSEPAGEGRVAILEGNSHTPSKVSIGWVGKAYKPQVVG